MVEDPDISSPEGRLKWARKRAGHKGSRSAAERHGWNLSTYQAHESGRNRFNVEQAAEYARAFKLEPEWLLFGGPPPDGPVVHEHEMPHAAPIVSGVERPMAGEVRRAALPASTSSADLPLDVPVYGTAAGSMAGAFQFEGGVVDYVRRPPALTHASDVYAIFIAGDSMAPAHSSGDLRFVHPHRPPQIGDTVVIVAQYFEGGPAQAFIKELVRRSGPKIHTRQFNPPADLIFEDATVRSIHKVLTMREMFGM